ncbi:hypothetical protein HA402_009894 [Bradysia odoriphaga]|nr:hypothetical protein HA402_009894 [Bradysia odoriphaga]
MDYVNYERFGGFFGLRICLKSRIVHRFTGFKSGDKQTITEFFKNTYHKDCLEKKLSLEGLNWGKLHFTGSQLRFDCGKRTSFEIPLEHVSQCTTDNEVTLAFHSNNAPVSLIEMRMHIPSESSDIEPIDEMKRSWSKQAEFKSMSDDVIAIFKEIQCLTPRGHYEIKMFRTFFHLHGKTFDYKIRMPNVLQMFLLPHKDKRQMFLVLSLDTPIKQGQTSYHNLVFLCTVEEEISIKLPFSKTELKRKYKSAKNLSGPVYEVFAKLIEGLSNRKIAQPGNFIGHTGTSAIDCSYKADAGYLYPLKEGFIYVHKPTIHIRFDEIASVNFARIGSSVCASTRTFDFEIELKLKTTHTFNSIANEDYSELFKFVTKNKLHLKNAGKGNYTCSRQVVNYSKNDGKFKNEKKEVKEMDGSFLDNLLDKMDKERPSKPPIDARTVCTTPPLLSSPDVSFSSSDEENTFPLPQVNRSCDAHNIPSLFDINVPLMRQNQPCYAPHIPSLFDINVALNWKS